MLAVAGRQHGLVTRTQLIDLGLHPKAIQHRVERGRLHQIRRGIYGVGSPRIGRRGHWMAAVLACGPDAAASHRTAGAVLEVSSAGRRIHVSVPAGQNPRPPGVVVHRRARLEEEEDVTTHRGIPVTSIVLTLVDLAGAGDKEEIEAAINEATSST